MSVVHSQWLITQRSGFHTVLVQWYTIVHFRISYENHDIFAEPNGYEVRRVYILVFLEPNDRFVVLKTVDYVVLSCLLFIV